MSSYQGSGFVGVSNYLKNTLIPSVTAIRSANIFDYEVMDLAGFPAATITLTEEISKVLDNARNEHAFKVTIRIFIDRNKQNLGANSAESILRGMVDDMTKKIDADPTLNGNCIDVKPLNVKYGYVDRESNNLRVAEIDLLCVDAVTWR